MPEIEPLIGVDVGCLKTKPEAQVSIDGKRDIFLSFVFFLSTRFNVYYSNGVKRNFSVSVLINPEDQNITVTIMLAYGKFMTITLDLVTGDISIKPMEVK